MRVGSVFFLLLSSVVRALYDCELFIDFFMFFIHYYDFVRRTPRFLFSGTEEYMDEEDGVCLRRADSPLAYQIETDVCCARRNGKREREARRRGVWKRRQIEKLGDPGREERRVTLPVPATTRR